MKEKTKVLLVYTDDDYGAVMFEQSDLNKNDMFDKAIANIGKHSEFIENDEVELYFEAYEFDKIPQEFLDFLNQEMLDYDSLKHKKYYIIN